MSLDFPNIDLKRLMCRFAASVINLLTCLQDFLGWDLFFHLKNKAKKSFGL